MVLMSENALPGIDGRWTSSKHAGVKTIQGKTLYWGFGMQFGINYLPMERLSYDHMGMARKGMLAGNKIDWNDDDCWTRQQNDPYSTTETLRLGARLAANSIGFCCHKGFKPEIPNQDNWSIVHVNGDFSVYTICDGHGLSGHHVADVTKDSLPRLLLQDPRFRRQRRDALVDAFENTQDLLRTADRQGLVKAAVGGTTATVVVHDHAEQKLQVAHVGDSAAVLGRMGQAEQFLAVPLTRARGHGARPSATRPRKRVVELDRADHHLEAEDERHRVEAVGARVEWEAGAYRAFNKHGTGAGLNVTRSLGDLDAHVECGISSEPEVILRLKKGSKKTNRVEHDMPRTPQRALAGASGGQRRRVDLDEASGTAICLTPLQEVLDIVAACGAAQPTVAAEREAYERWMQQTGRQAADDIVVLIIDLAARDRKDFA
ncbi:unnamed protein product [Durusdinium trenchii]|uniref:PPM-type phosphatase domain-containing protein n=1 Tax=Durusdinium trenchii TaxID=1381693 RepID=A0ABP0JNQ2_9DINO